MLLKMFGKCLLLKISNCLILYSIIQKQTLYIVLSEFIFQFIIVKYCDAYSYISILRNCRNNEQNVDINQLKSIPEKNIKNHV